MQIYGEQRSISKIVFDFMRSEELIIDFTNNLKISDEFQNNVDMVFQEKEMKKYSN